jgi:cholest-4-en-3-one 26-monooxygenase
MTITPTSVDQIDLTDCDLFLHGDPDAVWTTLRREAPVHWNERSWGPGFWNLTRYEDVLRVSTDASTFISGKGIILDNDGRRTQREQAMSSQGYGMDPRGNMMIMTDPPRHTVLRRIVNKGFTPLAVRRMEPHIRVLVTKIIDDVIERGECDFVLDISRRLPLEVICEMVGVPEGDWEGMFELTNRVIGFDDPEYSRDEITQEEMEMSFNLFQYMGELITSRRENPREDVLSTLVNTEIEGTSLNDGEIFLMFLLLIVAGNETTRNATTGGMLAMLNNPDQRQRLIADPSLIPTAVEEVVRWTSPVMHFERVATKDVEIGGQEIKEGDEVTLWYTSANRDEAVFENPQTFDVGRSPNEHIAFGKGEHFCLGANLARLELVVMFEELLKRIPDMELAGQPERLRSNFIRGIKRMPVTFTPGAKSA